MPETTELFVLVNADTERSLDCADCPEDLDFDKAYPLTCWEVYVVLRTGHACIARVNLEGSPTFEDDFKWAVREVRNELKFHNDCGEFNGNGPLVDIGYGQPCCGGCDNGNCCGGGSVCKCGG